VDGQQYKRRSPWGAWGLIFLTVLVYYFVWYYKINDEARRFLRDDRVRPGLSVLALFVPIVNLISLWRTGERIQRMEDTVGIGRSVEPILVVLAAIAYALHVPYLQSHLNKVWDRASVTAGLPSAPNGQPEIPPPPSSM
jgi:hypothetical protein